METLPADMLELGSDRVQRRNVDSFGKPLDHGAAADDPEHVEPAQCVK